MRNNIPELQVANNNFPTDDVRNTRTHIYSFHHSLIHSCVGFCLFPVQPGILEEQLPLKESETCTFDEE